jgi:hypothetical protein
MGNTDQVAVHMFSWEFVHLYHADNGDSVNGKRTLKFMFGKADSIEKILGTMLAPNGPIRLNRQIDLIRIVAHGTAGHLVFPAMWNAAVISDQWGYLQRYLNTNAQLEIHGCGVASQTSTIKEGADESNPGLANTLPGTFWGASDGKGLVYLRKAARVFGIPVTAGIDYQVVSANDWDFEHDTVTVYPSGKFKYDDCWTRGMTADAVNKQAEAESSRINSELILKNKPAEARVHLEMLIRNYPNTEAAKRARQRIAENNFAPLPAMAPVGPQGW